MELKSKENVRFGQAVFSPNSDEIIYATGYEFTLDGRILGLKGCYNRPSGIWRLTFPQQLDQLRMPYLSEKLNPAAVIEVVLQKLTPASLSCRSPRTFGRHGGSTLAWLACSTGGAHIGASALYYLDISSDLTTSILLKTTDKPLVPITKDEIPPSPLDFPGLYPYNLLASPGIVTVSELPSIVVHSHWGSRTTVLLIATKDGKVTDLTPIKEGLDSWTVLATDGQSRIVCLRSSTSVPYEILLGEFDNTGRVSWHLIDKPDLPEYSKSSSISIVTPDS